MLHAASCKRPGFDERQSDEAEKRCPVEGSRCKLDLIRLRHADDLSLYARKSRHCYVCTQVSICSALISPSFSFLSFFSLCIFLYFAFPVILPSFSSPGCAHASIHVLKHASQELFVPKICAWWRAGGIPKATCAKHRH